jgi:hypothetical protein
VPFPVFMGVGLVPFKPGAVLQRIYCCHDSSIRPSYTQGTTQGTTETISGNFV